MKPQLSGSVSLLKTFHKLAAKHFTENVFGKEEARTSGLNPMRVIARETAGSHDAVNMRMVLQLLIPCMENTEEADFGSEASGIGGDLD